MAKHDAIAAIATAAGAAAVGVVRVSGSSLSGLVAQLFSRPLTPRLATLVDVLDADDSVIDSGIGLFFPSPASYTGEDVLEFQGHGGRAVMHAVLQRCLAIGARLAEPGEFTRRAFLNGKLDLAQAESVADLIEATSEAAARAAVRSLRGEFSSRVNHLVDQLTHLRMQVEAQIDFPEEDVDESETIAWSAALQSVRRELEAILREAVVGRQLRDGIQVAIIGPPNVGKSSLFNALAREDVAIVTDIPGTTRDAVRAHINVEGLPLHLTDTAGLRESVDAVERLGIARAKTIADEADVVAYVVDATRASETLAGQLAEAPRADVIVMNKIDITGDQAGEGSMNGVEVIRVSARTGAGLDALTRAMIDRAGWHGSEGITFIARDRHIAALTQAKLVLGEAAPEFGPQEVFAETLRVAQRHLGEVTGAITSDELLGKIFERFCIGK